MTLRELEIQAIDEALERHDGNKPAAAEELGISLKTLYNKINQATNLEKSASVELLPGSEVELGSPAHRSSGGASSRNWRLQSQRDHATIERTTPTTTPITSACLT